MVVSFLAKQNFGNQKLIISFLILIFFNSCIFKNNSDNKAINNTIVKPILKSKKPEAIINHWVDTVPPSKISQTIERSFKFNLDTASYLLKEISVYSKNKKAIQGCQSE